MQRKLLDTLTTASGRCCGGGVSDATQIKENDGSSAIISGKSKAGTEIFAMCREIMLFQSESIKVDSKRYVKVQGYSSPFDSLLHFYWERRHGRREWEAIT